MEHARRAIAAPVAGSAADAGHRGPASHRFETNRSGHVFERAENGRHDQASELSLPYRGILGLGPVHANSPSPAITLAIGALGSPRC
jgi:hypothetical protein